MNDRKHMKNNAESSRKSTPKSRFRIAQVMLLAVVFLLAVFCGCTPGTRHRISQENARRTFEKAFEDIFPDAGGILIEPGSTKTEVCHICTTSALLFSSRAYTLLCSYDEADYPAEKAALDGRYEFRTMPLSTEYSFSGEKVKTIEPYTVVGNDVFRFVLPGDGTSGASDEFYKRCLMVAVNDAEHEIAYIVFEDQDLDIAQDLSRFLEEYCGWSYVR